MSIMNFKNRFASAGSGIEQQRSDLFAVQISFPTGITASNTGGTGLWDEYVRFAVKDFPFPERSVSVIPVKYLQQTNYQIGADEPVQPLTMTVRYAFNQQTAVLLETWYWMISQPYTGAVSLASNVKTSGYFYWLVPAATVDVQATVDDGTQMNLLQAYFLEGVIITGFKPTNADMESRDGLVNLELKLQVDRYYPISPSDLQLSTQPAVGTSILS